MKAPLGMSSLCTSDATVEANPAVRSLANTSAIAFSAIQLSMEAQLINDHTVAAATGTSHRIDWQRWLFTVDAFSNKLSKRSLSIIFSSPTISTPAFSTPACIMVPRFPLPRIQRPPYSQIRSLAYLLLERGVTGIIHHHHHFILPKNKKI